MKTKNFLSGALVLTVGAIICKLLGAFYRVPLASILGEVGLGVYQLIYPVYAFAIVFVSSGVTNALSYVVSTNKRTYSYFQLKKFFIVSLCFSSLISVVIALCFIVFSKNISFVLGNGNGWIGLAIAGVSAGLCGASSSIRGWFQGFEEMTFTAISQVLEQIVKVGIGIWLAIRFLPFGVAWSVGGAFIGVLAGEIIAIVYLFLSFILSKNKFLDISKSSKKLSFLYATKKFVSKWFAFTLSGIIVPFSVAIDSFLVVNLLKKSGFNQDISTALFGVQSGMINSLINFPMILALSLSSAIVPRIRGLIKQKKKREVQEKINLSIKLVLTLCLPCAFGMMAISSNILNIFYPKLSHIMTDVANDLLVISSINVVYLGLLQITTSILQALGYVYFPVLSNLMGCLFKIGLTLILVPINTVNIYGSAIAGVFAYLIPSLINIIKIKKQVKLTFNGKFIIVIIFATALMASFTYVINGVINNHFGNIISTAFCLIFAIVTYFYVMIKLGAISKKELLKKDV